MLEAKRLARPSKRPVDTADAGTLENRFRAFSERTTVVRGNLGFGRKTSRKAIEAAAGFGPVQVHHVHSNTEDVTIETVHDMTAILKENKRKRLSGHDGYTPSRDLRHVATIPNGVIVKLFQMGINPYRNEDWPKVAAMLDDPDYEWLRTAPGTISRRTPRQYFSSPSRKLAHAGPREL